MRSSKSIWPSKAQELSRELLEQVRITEKDWHQLKSDPKRRAAEQLAGAISQLLHGGEEIQVEQMTTEAIRWLKGEAITPKCPKH